MLEYKFKCPIFPSHWTKLRLWTFSLVFTVFSLIFSIFPVPCFSSAFFIRCSLDFVFLKWQKPSYLLLSRTRIHPFCCHSLLLFFVSFWIGNQLFPTLMPSTSNCTHRFVLFLWLTSRTSQSPCNALTASAACWWASTLFYRLFTQLDTIPKGLNFPKKHSSIWGFLFGDRRVRSAIFVVLLPRNPLMFTKLSRSSSKCFYSRSAFMFLILPWIYCAAVFAHRPWHGVESVLAHSVR